MRIEIAEHAGFCFGVERAIKLASDARNSYDKVATWGKLIHNEHVVNELRVAGIATVDSVSELTKDTVLVLRAHGVDRQVFAELEGTVRSVIDATCPLVKKVHAQTEHLSRQGLPVVVVGDASHPEVRGIVSYAGAEYFVVSDKEQIDRLPYRDKYGIVAQTTINEAVFAGVVEAIRGKCASIEVADTICSATRLRQDAALKLAKTVDVMLIVGGKNSANTVHLAEVCRSVCKRVFHIESADECDGALLAESLCGTTSIGITAGASTPDYVIDCVRAYEPESYMSANSITSA